MGDVTNARREMTRRPMRPRLAAPSSVTVPLIRVGGDGRRASRALCGVAKDVAATRRRPSWVGAALGLLLAAVGPATVARADDGPVPHDDAAPGQTVEDGGYHWAKSQAELALNAILILAQSDSKADEDLGWYVRAVPWRDKRKDRRFSVYFTPALKVAWIKAEKAALKRTCDGKYVDGDMCGIEIHPIICADDVNEAGNYYKTAREENGVAIVSYKWPESRKIIATYRMILRDRRWIMDGVACGTYITFNMTAFDGQ